jgi:hypothetical protein
MPVPESRRNALEVEGDSKADRESVPGHSFRLGRWSEPPNGASAPGNGAVSGIRNGVDGAAGDARPM